MASIFASALIAMTAYAGDDLLQQEKVIEDVTTKNVPAIQALIAKKYNFNFASEDVRPLDMAGVNCDPEMTQLLISAGANPDFSDPTSTYRHTTLEDFEHDMSKDQRKDPACQKTLAIMQAHSHDSPNQHAMDTMSRYTIDAKIVGLIAKDDSLGVIKYTSLMGARVVSNLYEKGEIAVIGADYEIQKIFSNSAK